MFVKSCLVLLVICALQENRAFAQNITSNVNLSGGPHNRNLDHLVKNLGRDYNRDVLPSDSTPVELSLTYLCPRLDPVTCILKSRVWVHTRWNDPRLRWNPSMYGGIENGRFPSHKLWNPDIMLYNSVEKEDLEWTNAVVSHDGDVLVVRPTTYTSHCSLTDDNEQVYDCNLKLGSWTYDGHMIPLHRANQGMDLSMLDAGCSDFLIREAITKIKKEKYECCPEEYHSMEVHLELIKRK